MAAGRSTSDSVAAVTRLRGGQLARGAGVLTSQYGVGSAGSVISHPHRALQVGPQQQEGAGVGLAPGRAPGRLGVEGARRAPRCAGGDLGPAGAEHAVARP